MTIRHKFEPGDLVQPRENEYRTAVGVVMGYKFAHGPTVHWLAMSSTSRKLVPSRSEAAIRNHADGALTLAILGFDSPRMLPYDLGDEAVALQMKARLS